MKLLLRLWDQLIILIIFACCSVVANGQIFRLADMNTTQIRALDRQKTVILMPGGTMEEHGPYLPSFTDGFMNEWWAEQLAIKIVKKPGWAVVIYPTIPLGDGGANEIGFRYVFPGSYGVRLKTLRSVYMDLGGELGEQGFRWIFVLQNHGSPMHNLALDQAGDYFSDNYKGVMLNLFGLEPAGTEDPLPSSEFQKEVGMDIHAGMSETSRVLFVRPDLVDPTYQDARPFTITDPTTFSSVAMKPDWLGYFSSPRLATADFGKEIMNHRLNVAEKIVNDVLGGTDAKRIPRYATRAMKEEAEIAKRSFAWDAKVEKKQQDWLRKRRLN